MKPLSNAIPIIVLIVAVLFIVSLPIIGWVVTSSFEAKAFNSVTGKNVSTLDAMFIELRVQESPE